MHIRFLHSHYRSLGLQYISSVLKNNGHQVDLVLDFNILFSSQAVKDSKKASARRKEIVKKVLSGGPDLIGFSVINNNINWALLMARQIKEVSSIPIAFGGFHATLLPESIIENDFVDYLVIGEGEFAFLELADALQNGKPAYDIKNIWMKKNGKVIKNPLRPPIGNLDSLPFPDQDLISIKDKGLYAIITGRGCPHTCSYCCAPYLTHLYRDIGNFLRRRSPENVILELGIAKRRYGAKRFFFEDDLFTYDKRWLNEFAEKYEKEIGLPSFVWLHPNSVDAEVIAALKKINCSTAAIGIQSLNEDIRRKVLLRYYSNDKIEHSLRLLKDAGILCECDNIICLPGEKQQDIIDMLRFYNETRPGILSFTPLKCFPKTTIALMELPGKKAAYGGAENNYLDPMGEFYGGAAEPEKKMKERMVLSSLFIYILPRRLMRFLINKKLYRFLPALENPSAIADMVFFASSFLNGYFKKAFYLSRGEFYMKIKYRLSEIFVPLLKHAKIISPENKTDFYNTRSVCPVCLKDIKSTITRKEGKVILFKQCPLHGGFEVVLSENPQYYLSLKDYYDQVMSSHKPQDKYLLYLTPDCNLRCPICALGRSQPDTRDISLEEIERLAGQAKNKAFVIFGAEPTCRSDIFEVIKILKKSQKVVYLYTNGLKLSDAVFTGKLMDSGVDKVYYQFDGFDEGVYEFLRGKKLLDSKLQGLEVLKKLNIPTVLNATIARDINEQEMCRVFKYALSNDFIKAVNFTTYELSGFAREYYSQGFIMPDQLVDAFLKCDGVCISREGIFLFQKLLYAFFSFLNKRTCFYIQCFWLVRRGKGYLPIDKVLNLRLFDKSLERYKVLYRKNKTLARIYFVASLYKLMLNPRAIFVLKDLFMVTLSFALGDEEYSKRSSKFLQVLFSTGCDPYKIDYNVLRNCNNGITYKGLDGRVKSINSDGFFVVHREKLNSV
jgi:radical SAM superfamily enzyme YgiQ (UPF0313 family)/uncharacterized radical SAM superfamily Fe-S cluster-containing enzyme